MANNLVENVVVPTGGYDLTIYFSITVAGILQKF
jgi:hypothetical protein